MKQPIDFIAIRIYADKGQKPWAAVNVQREIGKHVREFDGVSPASLRRAQRAQLALLGIEPSAEESISASLVSDVTKIMQEYTAAISAEWQPLVGIDGNGNTVTANDYDAELAARFVAHNPIDAELNLVTHPQDAQFRAELARYSAAQRGD